MLAGIIFAVVGLLRPSQMVSSVTTSTWIIVHCLTIAMSFFGLLGITGIYARQVENAGWMGLAGFVLLSLWFVLMTGFTVFEAFIMPLLATDSPKFAASFLGIFTGSAGETSVGVLSTLSSVLGVVYILGGLLFGIAMFRVASCHTGRPACLGWERVIPSLCIASAILRATGGSASRVGSDVAGIFALV
jgi:hypothetical protein